MSIYRLPLEANGHLISRKSELEVLRLDIGGQLVVFGEDHYRCAFCDQWPTFNITEAVVAVRDPCPYPDGITTTITFNIPSGKLLVADDLRPIYDWYDTNFASYSSAIGKAQAIKAMAAIGCAFGPASNCGLGLYRTGPDNYIIATPTYDDDDNPSIAEDTQLAKICTDLWAYSMVDFQAWKTRGGDPAKLGYGDTVVDIPPGTYQVVHHSGERGFEWDIAETVVWAHMERIACPGDQRSGARPVAPPT
ncbi:hypothetical protein GCM10009733_020750 [Nonomuraea maheshkhaliensis]|uniref:Uncharacterized protein n=1 Tax=Nonomuraea maheshkhaliensis TaxID=419590 RepID=A0ABN2F2E2_9ACTN